MVARDGFQWVIKLHSMSGRGCLFRDGWKNANDGHNKECPGVQVVLNVHL